MNPNLIEAVQMTTPQGWLELGGLFLMIAVVTIVTATTCKLAEAAWPSVCRATSHCYRAWKGRKAKKS